MSNTSRTANNAKLHVSKLKLLLACGILLLAGTIASVVTVVMPGHAHAHSGAIATDTTAARITTVREGDLMRIFVENSELSEVTMTFDFSIVNMDSSVEFPYTATFKPGSTEAFTLTPSGPGVQWQYSYTNYYKLGSSDAQHDEAFVYHLPYVAGSTYKVSQGYNGRFSHTGSNKYAIDWKMPEGTPVCAARGGLVVKVKDGSSLGGSSMKYDRYNNYVLIRHDDGTLGHYCHLKQDSAQVAAGDIVRAGDIIALSGNTGFSSGPHLHFCVFKTKDGRERESIPVRFRNEEGQAVTLVTGRKYKAPAAADEPAIVSTDAGGSLQ